MSIAFRREFRAVLRLALPLAAAQVGQMLLGLVDTAVVGRLGASELAAVGVGNSIFFTLAIFGTGLVLGVEPTIAQAVGAGRIKRARGLVTQGQWLGLILSLPLAASCLGLSAVARRWGIDGATAALAEAYVASRVVSLVPLLAFGAVAAFLQSVGRTRPIVIGALLANVVNLPLSWLLVLGSDGLVRLGLESPWSFAGLGVAGAGIASTIVSLVQWGVVAVAVREPAPETRRPARIALLEALRLGWPIGLQRLVEVFVFSAVAILMARISTEAAAAHQVAITLASFTFMVPLGVSAAAAIRVGRAVGADDPQGVRLAGAASIVVGGVAMAGFAVVMLAAPRALGRLLSDDAAVVKAAVPLVQIAALFQIADGIQVVSAGALRGMGDTRMALGFNLLGHYAVGMPVGLWLAFAGGLGGAGLWWGLAAGLFAVGVALSIRFFRLAARPWSPPGEAPA